MNTLVSLRFHRIRLLAPVYFLAALLTIPLFTGCSRGDGLEFVSETEERGFQRGRQLLREGRRPDALTAFLGVIEKRRGDAPESHLEVGELYRTHFRNPIYAIYHYRKFLELSPNSPQAPHVRQLIETATKDFAATLPAQPMQVQHERLDLLETVERLQRENVALKRDLAGARQELGRVQQVAQTQAAAPRPAAQTTASTPAAASQVNVTPTAQRPAAGAAQRTYTVVAGDTLTHISGKVYGTSARWRDIFEANRDVMANENSLRIGMQLRIPE
jgi:LysM repeat protein